MTNAGPFFFPRSRENVNHVRMIAADWRLDTSFVVDSVARNDALVYQPANETITPGEGVAGGQYNVQTTMYWFSINTRTSFTLSCVLSAGRAYASVNSNRKIALFQGGASTSVPATVVADKFVWTDKTCVAQSTANLLNMNVGMPNAACPDYILNSAGTYSQYAEKTGFQSLVSLAQLSAKMVTPRWDSGAVADKIYAVYFGGVYGGAGLSSPGYPLTTQWAQTVAEKVDWLSSVCTDSPASKLTVPKRAMQAASNDLDALITGGCNGGQTVYYANSDKMNLSNLVTIACPTATLLGYMANAVTVSDGREMTIVGGTPYNTGGYNMSWETFVWYVNGGVSITGGSTGCGR